MNVLLIGLEISLRTNPLTWVQEFLAYQDPDPEREKLQHGGLDILLTYFKNIDDEGKYGVAIAALIMQCLLSAVRANHDEHLCVMCLRALMNNSV